MTKKTIKELNEEFTFRSLQDTLPFRLHTDNNLIRRFNSLTNNFDNIDFIDNKPMYEEELEKKLEIVRYQFGPALAQKSIDQTTKIPVTRKEFIALNGYMPQWKTWKEKE